MLAIGDVRDPQVLATRQQVLNPLRYQRTERNLEGQGTDIDIVVSTRARMKIDAVASESNGVGESLRCDCLL